MKKLFSLILAFNFLLDKEPGATYEVDNPVHLVGGRGCLINYFFFGLTLKKDAFWVNLQPNQENKITSPELAKTDLGKVLLEQDLMLQRARFKPNEIMEGSTLFVFVAKKANSKLPIVSLPVVNIVSSSIVNKPGGIDLNNIEIILKDEKFISHLNPADFKILFAAKALKEGANSLSLLRVHEAMGLLKSDIVKSIRNKPLLIQLFAGLQSRNSLDSQGMQFLYVMQRNKSIIKQ